MMENEKVFELLNKYNQQTCTVEEKAIVESWYNDYASKQEASFPDADLDEDKTLIWNKISETQFERKVWRLKHWKTVVTIAAAIAIIVPGIYLFLSIVRQDSKQNNLTALDVAPGKIGATLTLANGKKVRLSNVVNRQIAQQGGVAISKTADGHLIYQIENTKGAVNSFNTLSTDKGETYVVILPDRSKVWLNASSSLTYSTNLNDHGIRRVKLQGEAYFKVFKDKAHPFVVRTGNQQVVVLGTEFNINNYRDEPAIATSLIEGSVKVISDKLQEQTIIPGEQLSNDGKNFKVSKVNLDNVADWKDGEFNFQHLPFRVAMRKIARWYDVEVIYDSSVPDNIISGGWISREVKLSTILEGIESSKLVKFRLEGRKLYVSK
ncbi:FecR family protein [Pedobacter agri]|uniref:FecR family protein n=1 Tax=Pedobacter agri TaxID=454586 RepID=UPI002931DB42|nr:FecR domain-containing protein [Pedobacter agri]